MGLYTEIYFNSRLIDDLPDDAIAVMTWLRQKPNLIPRPNTPNHPFFSTPRWIDFSGRGGDIPGAHFFIFSTRLMNTLTLRCSLKNYDDEIDLFLDWIAPYVYIPEPDPEGNYYEGDRTNNIFLGFYRREDIKHPKVLYWHNSEIRKIEI